jgi:hypothetical protein
MFTWEREVRSPIKALTVSIVLLLLPSVSKTIAATCQNANPPIVTIRTEEVDVEERFDTTAADLRRAAAAMGAKTHEPLLAAYSSDLTYAANIFEDARQEAGGVFCATLSSIDVLVTLKNRVIHLARELQQTPCVEKAQREHWREHARVDAQAVQEFPLLSQLRQALAELPPAQAHSVMTAKTQVTVAVRSELQKLMDKLDSYRATLKQKVDTPDSIEHLRAEMEKKCVQ